MKGLSLRVGAVLLALALAHCTSGQGHFAVTFAWASGATPPNSPMYMYAQIQPVGSTQPIAISGPDLYKPGGQLSFGAVPTGTTQLVVNAQLKDSPGSAGQVLAYGLSDPFTLPPGKDVTITVQLQLHTVLAVPMGTTGTTGTTASGILVITPNNSGQVNAASPVSLELFAPTGATQAVISNLPALPAGDGTKSVPSLMPDANPPTAAPAGFQAVRYTGWDLDAGLGAACAPGSVCNRSVYVYFLDANNVASATSSASVILNRQTPKLVNPVATPAAAKVGSVVSIVATPSEPLAGAPVAHVYLEASGGDTPVLGFLTFQPGTVYSFQSAAITSTTANGTYYVQFDLVDVAGNTATYPADKSLSFIVNSVVPSITAVMTDAAVYSEVPPQNLVTLTFNVAEAGATATATLSGQPMNCGSGYHATAPNFTCTFPVTLPMSADGGSAVGGITSGPQPIAISSSDAAGNSDATTTSVTFDFNPPVLTPSVSPNPANAGSSPFLSVASSKTLSTASVTGLERTAGSGTVTAGPMTGSGTAWSAPLAGAGANGSFTAGVTGTDTLGHTSTASAAFTVDAVIPAITHVATNATTYSEVSPFNVISLTFNTAKQASTVTVSGAAASWNACTYASPTYTCTSSPLLPPLGSGNKTISISATDEVGNNSQTSAPVIFDFSPVVVSATVSPNPANASSPVAVLSVAASKPLVQAPNVTVTPVGTPVGNVTAGSLAGSGTSWTVPIGAVTPTVAGTFTLVASGTDDVGHTASSSPVSFEIDNANPTLTSVALNRARYSAVSPYNTVSLTFNYSDTLDGSAANALHVVIGGYTAGHAPMTMACSYASTTQSYTCTYANVGTELSSDNATAINALPQVELPITISATDSAGNVVFNTTATATYDYVPPALTAAPGIEYIPAPNMFTTGVPAACLGAQNVLTSVAAATTCTDIRASFAITEQLGATPSVTAASGGIVFAQSSASGSTYIYDATTTVPGTPADDPAYGLTIAAVDLVGNAATLTPVTPTIDLLTTPPGTAPNTAASGPITYARVPWGDRATNAVPTFSISGGPGAALPSASILAYDGPATTADLIGHVSTAANGSFAAMTLSRNDRPVVWVANADTAGNLSPVVAVHNVSWTASFNGKISGSTAANPHVMLTNPSASLTPAAGWSQATAGTPLLATMAPGPGVAPELTAYSGLFPGASTPVKSAFAPVWEDPAGGSPGPGTRSAHAVAYDSARGVLVVFGGCGTNQCNSFLNDTWEWNGLSWTQAAPVTSPPVRYGHAMAYDAARGVTVLFGGNDTGSSGGTLGDTWEWDGTNWTQQFPLASPSPRYQHAMAYDAARGVTVLFGGWDEGDTWEWNGTTWTQLSPAASPSARAEHAMAYDPVRGVTILFGGSANLTTLLNDTWAWNGETWTQLSPATSPAARAGHAMAYDPARDTMVLFGGATQLPPFPFLPVTLTGDTWEWDGVTWTPISPPSSPSQRYQHAMAYDAVRGVTVMLGGNDSGDLNDVWEWANGVWTQVLPPVAPPGRYNHVMSYDTARGVTVLFGGTGLSDTWEWNGAAWSLAFPGGSMAAPAPREGGALVYDTARGVSLLFGGYGGYSTTGPLGDTWEWNGTAWTQVASGPARIYHAMAYDSARGVTVLFGGQNSSTIYGDTWEWDGTAWTQLSPPASPPVRALHAMAYDSARAVTVLFGGVALDGSVLRDTWVWNGSQWTQLASGPPREGHAMAYNAARGVTMMYGGGADDTWEWNGASWAQIFPAASLPARSGQAMVYDVARGVTVVFGGMASLQSTVLSDTWLLPDDTSSFPVDIAQFDFGSTGETVASATLQQLSMSVMTGGTGYTTPSPPDAGVPVAGAALAAWDNSAGGAWRLLATNESGTTGPLTYNTSSPAQAAAFAFGGPWETLDFAVFPAQPNGNGASAAQLEVGDPELTVLYAHSETACTLQADGSCLCAADENACGTDGGPLICADYQSDPQNCGGCTATGAGTLCAGGQWCVGGACACPAAEQLCEGVCTDTMRDPLNCGGCTSADAGSACGFGSTCVGGACTAYSGCTPASCEEADGGPYLCHRATGRCVECESNADCACPFGTVDAGACAFPATPYCNAAGACVQCVTDSQCANGVCANGKCEGCPDAGMQAQVGCAGVCTNTASDPNNCGGCGVTCGVGNPCNGGVCG